MYTIREDQVKKLLIVEVSGTVKTEEALRAISQSFALSEASKIRAIRCDITELAKGPAGLLMLAASVTLRYRPGMRVALRANQRQLRVATRLATFSGLRDGMKAFDSDLEADTWLRPALASTPATLSSTARRHAEALLLSAAPVDQEPLPVLPVPSPRHTLGVVARTAATSHPLSLELDDDEALSQQRRANPAA